MSPIITPDGPRGPRFKFKPGAILLAQMSGRPMLPLAYAASRAALVHWDRFVLPLPFARIAIAIGPPREVPRTLAPPALAALQLEMQQSAARDLWSGAGGAVGERARRTGRSARAGAAGAEAPAGGADFLAVQS